jgi:hypothetical protein
MRTVSGIEIEKNQKGQDAFIRIDLKKYKKQLQPFLEEVGIADDAFEKEWKSSLTKDALVKKVNKHIKTLLVEIGK